MERLLDVLDRFLNIIGYLIGMCFIAFSLSVCVISYEYHLNIREVLWKIFYGMSF